jgi:hypothetical protein
VYSPQKQPTFLKIGQGVKQGDSTSALLFCLAADYALQLITDGLAALHINAQVYMYMDDITICINDPTRTDQTVKMAMSALKKIGLDVNADKSSVLAPATCGITAVPQHDPKRPFVVLGANVSNNDEAEAAFAAQIMLKQQRYFDKMSTLAIHPQCMMTLARIAGAPRLQYHISVIPPEHSTPVAQHFDESMRHLVNVTLDPTNTTRLPAVAIHSDDGLGIPQYATATAMLYTEYKMMALNNAPPPRLKLTIPTNPQSQLAIAQADSQWLFYTKTAPMAPHDYVTAIFIRLNTIPDHIRIRNTKCACGHVHAGTDEASIDHVLTCDRSSTSTHTTRHNAIRDATAQCARDWGIPVSTEPTAFSYPDGKHHRPDALFATEPLRLVTDFSMTSRFPAQDHIATIEKHKKQHHHQPVANEGCVFIPAVMATRGLLGSEAERFIKTLSKALPDYSQRYFVRDIRHRIATAAAIGRARSLRGACDRNLWA